MQFLDVQHPKNKTDIFKVLTRMMNTAQTEREKIMMLSPEIIIDKVLQSQIDCICL